MAMPLQLPNPLQPAVDELNTPTTTAQQVVSDQNQDLEKKPPQSEKTKKKNDEFRSRVDICKLYRRKLIANWTISIDYRRGKPFTSQTDEDQVAVNLDWSLTKAKQAALFSQIPQVRIDHIPESLPNTSPWAMKFQSLLNDTLNDAGVESTMDECLPDCINAAGLGIALVAYEALTEDHDVPIADPMNPQATDQGTTTVPYAFSHRYTIERVSPADFLWPINYAGSNFDKGPWVGRSGRITWSEAVQRFKLLESEKEAIIGEDRPMMDKLTHDVERDKVAADLQVGFDELFYKEYCFDSEAKSFDAIHHLVFVNGKDDPVIDEPWKGQKTQPDGSIVGALKFPIRVLTLAYLTDEAIPPSDSAIGRPQVNEINRGRTQMIRQRERSLPIRAFDVNRVDPTIQQSLMRGTWQAMIPVQGDGSRVITEITRAQMPQENFAFDKIAKADLNEEWVVGQAGAAVNEGKGDPNQNQSGLNTQVGRERAKVASFFVSLAEVLGGLMCLYEDPSQFGEGFEPGVSKILKYSILADSTVLLDAGQKLARLNQFLEVHAKSGWVNIEPVMQEIATLTGLDPTVVIKAPQPKPPVEPNISLRLTGVEDLLNPLALAVLIMSGQAPTQDMIEKAKQLIQQAVVPPQGMQMPGSVQPVGGLPMLPAGAPPGGPPASSPPPPGHPTLAPAPHPGAPVPAPPPPAVGEAHPEWTHLNTLGKRTESGGTQ